MDIPLLPLRGTPRAMGRAHGAARREAIRAYAAERVAKAGGPVWTGRSIPRDRVLELAASCLDAHADYSPRLFEELLGMAEATDLEPAELIVAGGFTDFIDLVFAVGAPGEAQPVVPVGSDDCTAVLVPGSRAAEGSALFAQTWDMHESSTEHVVLLQGEPDDGVPFYAFTTAGCLGMVGMNAHGLTVGINNLLGGDAAVGVTWPFVVREMLTERTLDGALDALERAPLAGAHNYLVLDADGNGANVEAATTRMHVTPLELDPLVHTNHCIVPSVDAVARQRDPISQGSSEARLARGHALLDDATDVTVDDLKALTRDDDAICYRGQPPHFVGTCGAVVANPRTREFWAVRGMPSEGAYQRFGFDEEANAPTPSTPPPPA